MKTTISLLILVCSYSVFSQQLLKSSMDNGGSITNAGNFQVVYTLGETFTRELEGSIKVSEGFINSILLDKTLSMDLPVINSEKIVLYPNPATKTIVFEGLKKSTEFILYDLTGRIIYRGKLFLSNNRLDISNLQNGNYYIKLKNKKTIPFIKK